MKANLMSNLTYHTLIITWNSPINKQQMQINLRSRTEVKSRENWYWNRTRRLINLRFKIPALFRWLKPLTFPPLLTNHSKYLIQTFIVMAWHKIINSSKHKTGKKRSNKCKILCLKDRRKEHNNLIVNIMKMVQLIHNILYQVKKYNNNNTTWSRTCNLQIKKL